MGEVEKIPVLSPEITTHKQADFLNHVEGIKFLRHDGGCGGMRQDATILSKLLAAYADHPNVGGITVLSLGCQNLQAADFYENCISETRILINHYIFSNSRKIESEEQLITTAIKTYIFGPFRIK